MVKPTNTLPWGQEGKRLALALHKGDPTHIMENGSILQQHLHTHTEMASHQALPQHVRAGAYGHHM
jgi:hypothetical protein